MVSLVKTKGNPAVNKADAELFNAPLAEKNDLFKRTTERIFEPAQYHETAKSECLSAANLEIFRR